MTDALAAALLASQRGQQQFDPAANSRRFAQQLMQQGASTAPVAHPVEGIARALQGGLGGFFEGAAEREQQSKNKKLIEGLTGAMSEKDPAKRMDILKGISDDGSGVLAPFFASMLSQQVAAERQNGILDTRLDASGVPRPGAPSAQPGLGGGQQGPLTINMTPLPAPQQNGAAAASSPNTQQAMEFLTKDPDLQLQPHQAAALVGRLYGESGIQPGAVNPKDSATGGPSVGISQWNDSRLAALNQFAQSQGLDPKNLQTQLQFMKTELLGPERNTLEALRKAPSVNEAAPTAVGYFRPKDVPAAVASTTNLANHIYGQPTPEQVVANGGPPVPQSPQVSQGGEAQPQVAQAPQQAPQAAPVTALPEVSPAAQQLMQQAQQARAGRDRERALALAQKAQEAQAAYVQERAKTGDTRAFDQQEFDRRQVIEKQNKDPTEFQGKSGTYADRMVQNNAILDQVDKTGTSGRGRFFEAVPGGNLAQSQDYRKFQTAKDNWIAANARQESGAVIGPQEYASMDKQYFPQPNDGPDIIKQKAALRKAATDAMIRNAGDKYKSPAVAAGPAPPPDAVNDLRANPSTAAQFDEVFGSGAAARALGR